MKKFLGLAFISMLLVGLVACSEENDTSTPANDNKATAEEAEKESAEASTSIMEATELNEQTAKDFYELFSQKIINYSHSSIPQPIADFFTKPTEPGFFYGLPEGTKSHSAAEEVEVYYHLLKDVGLQLETDLEKQETHNYTTAEEVNGKYLLKVDYELVVGEEMFNEKREIVITLVNNEVKIESFEIRNSPVVEILKRANS